jgi:hypothetical protein
LNQLLIGQTLGGRQEVVFGAFVQWIFLYIRLSELVNRVVDMLDEIESVKDDECLGKVLLGAFDKG